MSARDLTRAWLLLIALSGLSTAVALTGKSGLTVSLLILALAWAKALVILNDYLGLRSAPNWKRGFAMAIGVFMLLAMLLVAAAPPPG